MRYFKKTAVGVLALVLLSGLAWKLEQRASQSAADAAPVTEASVPPVEVIAVDLLYIKSKTTTEQQKEINAWVKIAVTAAEQIYKGQGRGEEKKEYVLAWLREHGVTVDDKKLDAMIEAAVYELTNNGLIAIEQGIAVEGDSHDAG